MNRLQVLLGVLLAVLVVVGFFFLVVQPQRDTLADIDQQVEAQREEQVALQSEIDRLRTVREDAPEVEADIAAAAAIVPEDPSLPAALRQFQTAGDEAGVVLRSVTTARPVDLEVGPDGLSAIDITLQVGGSYFQLVDFLRRIEDPTITPRGTLWSDASLSTEEYPELNVALTGRVFAIIETPPPPDEASPDDNGDADGDTAGDDDEGLDLEDDLENDLDQEEDES